MNDRGLKTWQSLFDQLVGGDSDADFELQKE
jgi:hypothetical protein